LAWVYSETLSQKKLKQKGLLEWVVQAAEHLSNKCEDLSLTPVLPKQDKTKQQKTSFHDIPGVLTGCCCGAFMG
jgi:hypothetical protein